MAKELKVGLIGLDTSHSILFTRMLQDATCPDNERVSGMKVVNCLRFSTPFQSEEGLNERQKQLEDWGVNVVERLEDAVTGCDVLMLEINDPAYHLEYFKKCMDLGLPIFLDKPLADNIENGRLIYELSKERNLRVFSSSSLRYTPALEESCIAIPTPRFASMYGPLGKAPAGSSVVWYGVHAFEMLQRAMGSGAQSVYARKDSAGVVATVEYGGGRRGVVEMSEDTSVYGGCLRSSSEAVPFVVDAKTIFRAELMKVIDFFNGSPAPVDFADTLEIMSMLDAAERSTISGQVEAV